MVLYIYTLVLLIYTSISIINKSIYIERELYSRIYICCLLVQMGCTTPLFLLSRLSRVTLKGGGERPCIMWCDGWFVLQDCRLKQDCTYSDNLQKRKTP